MNRSIVIHIFYPIGFALIIISMIGPPHGADWWAYSNFTPAGFNYYREWFSWQTIFLGLQYFELSSSVWFIIIYSILIYLCVAYFYKIGGRYIFILYPLLFSNFLVQFSANGLRQGLAFIFLLLVLCYSRWVISALLAFFSHNSSLLFFFLRRQLVLKWRIIFMAPFVIFISAFYAGHFEGAYSQTPGSSRMVFTVLLSVGFFYFLYHRKSSMVLLVLFTLAFFPNENFFVRLCYYSIPILYINLVANIKLERSLASLVQICCVMFSPAFYLHPSIQFIFTNSIS
jgi:hypothetical protein